MADVLVMYKKSDMIPMVVTEKHIEEIEKCISGKVYWCGSEEEALEKGYDAEILFIWGGSGKMPETYCKQSKRLKWINSFSAGVNPTWWYTMAPAVKTFLHGQNFAGNCRLYDQLYEKLIRAVSQTVKTCMG